MHENGLKFVTILIIFFFTQGINAIRKQNAVLGVKRQNAESKWGFSKMREDFT